MSLFSHFVFKYLSPRLKPSSKAKTKTSVTGDNLSTNVALKLYSKRQALLRDTINLQRGFTALRGKVLFTCP